MNQPFLELAELCESTIVARVLEDPATEKDSLQELRRLATLYGVESRKNNDPGAKRLAAQAVTLLKTLKVTKK